MKAIIQWLLLIVLCPVWLVGFTCYAIADWLDSKKPRQPVKDGDK